MTVYHSARTLAESYDFCISTARAIIKEIRTQVDAGRYDAEAILDGCGTRVREDVVIDYLHYRKLLKRAPEYVPAFEGVSSQ